MTLTGSETGRSISPEDAQRIVRAVRFQSAGERPSKRETIKDRLADIGVTNAKQNVNLRRHLAYWVLGAVGVQLLCYNVAFMSYGWVRSWEIETSVMITWMGTGLLEILGVLGIIAKALFPGVMNGPNTDAVQIPAPAQAN